MARRKSPLVSAPSSSVDQPSVNRRRSVRPPRHHWRWGAWPAGRASCRVSPPRRMRRRWRAAALRRTLGAVRHASISACSSHRGDARRPIPLFCCCTAARRIRLPLWRRPAAPALPESGVSPCDARTGPREYNPSAAGTGSAAMPGWEWKPHPDGDCRSRGEQPSAHRRASLPSGLCRWRGRWR